MYRIALLIPVLALIGCGSKSEQPSSTGAVPLSIKSPVSRQPDETSKSDITQPVENKAVENLLANAQTAISAGQYATAIESLSQAIGIDTRDARLFEKRAEVYVLLGENANARADLSMAIQADPNNAELYNVRGYFLMTHGASKDAVADFNKAISLDSNLAAAYNNRGLVSLADKKYEEAEADFSKAIETDRKYADALNNRGFVRMKMEQFDSALVDLKQTVKIEPAYATAWNNCGLVHMTQENFALAVDAFSNAIEHAPLDVRWVNHRRAALLKLERFDEASADARRIRWLNDLAALTQNASARPTDPKVWLQRATHLADGAEFIAAIQDYSRALAVDPANTNALNGRAAAWLESGELRNAIKDCDQSLIVNATSEAFALRGDAWFALKDFDQAISDFESARRFDDVVADAYRQRGLAHKSAGRTKEAKADQQKADEILAGLEGKLTPKSSPQPIPFPDDVNTQPAESKTDK